MHPEELIRQAGACLHEGVSGVGSLQFGDLRRVSRAEQGRESHHDVRTGNGAEGRDLHLGCALRKQVLRQQSVPLVRHDFVQRHTSPGALYHTGRSGANDEAPLPQPLRRIGLTRAEPTPRSLDEGKGEMRERGPVVGRVVPLPLVGHEEWLQTREGKSLLDKNDLLMEDAESRVCYAKKQECFPCITWAFPGILESRRGMIRRLANPVLEPSAQMGSSL